MPFFWGGGGGGWWGGEETWCIMGDVDMENYDKLNRDFFTKLCPSCELNDGISLMATMALLLPIFASFVRNI